VPGGAYPRRRGRINRPRRLTSRAGRRRRKIFCMKATPNTRRHGEPLVGAGRMIDQGFATTGAEPNGAATAGCDAHRALLAVSEAIVSHRDLSALFHELAGRLHEVVRFDYLALILHEP